MRLRYVGTQRVTFTGHGLGEVSPGDEIDVPDDVAEAFTRRSDVAPVETPEPAPTPEGRSATSDSATDDEPVTEPTTSTEEVCDVPDDH